MNFLCVKIIHTNAGKMFVVLCLAVMLYIEHCIFCMFYDLVHIFMYFDKLINPWACMYICTSIHPPIHPSIHPPTNPSSHPSLCTDGYVCTSIYPSICARAHMRTRVRAHVRALRLSILL